VEAEVPDAAEYKKGQLSQWYEKRCCRWTIVWWRRDYARCYSSSSSSSVSVLRGCAFLGSTDKNPTR